MVIFQGLFFLILGGGLIGVAGRSLATGWLPCGPKGLWGRVEFDRASQPLGYWIMFVAYGVAGAVLLVYALRLMAGDVEPLPLR